jgi:Mitochondrial carrier protein
MSDKTIQQPKQNFVFKNMINSAIATGFAEFITLPICSIRTNYINSVEIPKPKIYDIIKTKYSSLGIKWFFSATYPAVAGQIISTSSKYTLYRLLPLYNPLNKLNQLNQSNQLNQLNQSNQLNQIYKKWLSQYAYNASNGIMAGILSSLITHPLDYLKINKQMNPNNFIFNAKHIYRGYSKSFSKAVIGGATFFPIYDTVRSNIDNPILSSCISATLSTIIIQPIDYLKVRQIYGIKDFKVVNLFDGLGLNLARIVPHFIIVMSLIDLLDRI